jgi:hypothetical protein
MVLDCFFIEYEKMNGIPTIKLKYICHGVHFKYIHLSPVECKDILCKCTVYAVLTAKYCNMQWLVV